MRRMGLPVAFSGSSEKKTVSNECSDVSQLLQQR